MKSYLERLRNLALHQRDAKEKSRDHQYSVQLDDLAQASQDMQDMRSCYDSLLSAAAAAANSAYEFSESLLEMGTCFLENTTSSACGETGRVLLMLGRVQLELQKLVDSYRSHIVLTITNPSESLLSELHKVEEMKLQCDEKRGVYEHMLAKYIDKGRLKSGKGENITSQQVKEARIEYDDVARLFIFRVKSLKQGQCRSLLTQAARHHTAQLNFFRKGHKSLNEVEPQVKQVSEKQHIDYQFVGLDEAEDEQGASMDNYENNDDRELSFDYRQNKQGFDNDCTSRISVEITLSKNQGVQAFSQQPRRNSYSAPIYPEKSEPPERSREVKPSVWKSHTYVLPTPTSAKISASSTPNLQHSSLQKHESSNNSSIPLPHPSTPPLDIYSAFNLNKSKRQAFSGPILSKPWSTKPISRSASPTPVSSPRLSELHELPRPPGSLCPSVIGHSAPLVSRNHEHSPTNRSVKLVSTTASPLPTPPLTVPRSFSIPSSSRIAKALHPVKLFEQSQIPVKVEEVTSPPLTPIHFQT